MQVLEEVVVLVNNQLRKGIILVATENRISVKFPNGELHDLNKKDVVLETDNETSNFLRTLSLQERL